MGQVESTSADTSTPNPQEKPVFGPRPDTQAADFDFEAEVKCLPFKLNLGDEGKLTHVQQSWFINLFMTILRSSHFMMRILDFVTGSSIRYQQRWTNLCI